MQIKTIKGYLTAKDKQVVKYMLQSKIRAGKAGKKEYYLMPKAENTYKLMIKVKDRGLIPCAGSPLRISFYHHEFITN